MTDQLKPCPFCSQIPYDADCLDDDDVFYTQKFSVKCDNNLKCPAYVQVKGSTKDEAINRWNTRASDEKMAKFIEFVKRAYKVQWNYSDAEKLLKEIGEL